MRFVKHEMVWFLSNQAHLITEEENRNLPKAPEAGPTISEAIQNLPPELWGIIMKEYLAIKMREQSALGWGEVHEQISKLRFCHNRQRVVRMIICFTNESSCPFEGCCYPCFDQGIEHKLPYSPPIEYIPLLKICPWDCDWYELEEETFVRGKVRKHFIQFQAYSGTLSRRNFGRLLAI